jgi:hypothetical protein
LSSGELLGLKAAGFTSIFNQAMSSKLILKVISLGTNLLDDTFGIM